MEQQTTQAAGSSVAAATTTLQKFIDTVIEFFVNYSFQVIGALLILVVGSLIANWVARLLLKLFEGKQWDITLSKFIAGTAKVLILTFALIAALGNFGITVAPFIAALGAVAFGASFALQGPLANYGAGLSIILTRPYVVGNTITVAGVSGVVQEVKLACTILTDEDGVTITIPNKHIVGQTVENSRANKIAQGVIGVSYGDDPEKAVQAVRDALAKFDEIVHDPAPQVGVQEFGDSSVNIAYRYWIPTQKFFKISFAVNLAVYKAVGEAGLTIPFPQRDVHMISQAAPAGEPAR